MRHNNCRGSAGVARARLHRYGYSPKQWHESPHGVAAGCQKGDMVAIAGRRGGFVKGPQQP